MTLNDRLRFHETHGGGDSSLLFKHTYTKVAVKWDHWVCGPWLAKCPATWMSLGSQASCYVTVLTCSQVHLSALLRVQDDLSLPDHLCHLLFISVNASYQGGFCHHGFVVSSSSTAASVPMSSVPGCLYAPQLLANTPHNRLMPCLSYRCVYSLRAELHFPSLWYLEHLEHCLV